MTLALIAAACIASISVLGAFFFGRAHVFVRTSHVILPFAVGTFLAVVFFELIPEAVREAGTQGSIAIAVGFLFFYALSHILRTYHHHHDEHCHDEATARGATLILVGDAIHNFADGIVIAGAFMISPTVGIVTTVGIALHEIPQEIAEYAVFFRAGYSRMKAALYNLVSASTVLVGVMATYFFLTYFENLIGILIGLAAGNLLYIAASDILPHLHGEDAHPNDFWPSFLATLAGIVLMSSLLLWSHQKFEPETTPLDGLATLAYSPAK